MFKVKLILSFYVRVYIHNSLIWIYILVVEVEVSNRLALSAIRCFTTRQNDFEYGAGRILKRVE